MYLSRSQKVATQKIGIGLLIIALLAIPLALGVTAPHTVNATATSQTVYGSVNKDTYAESGYPTIATNNARMYVGYDTWYGKGRTRAFVKFNLPSLPSGAQVNSAKAQLYQYADECSGNYGVTAYKITSSWNPNTLTWNNQPSKGGSVGSASFSCSDGWKSIDITGLVRNWYQGQTNRGITIRANNEYNPGGIFRSKEHTGNHPRLKVTYSIPPTPTPQPTDTPEPETYNTAWLTNDDLTGDYNTSVATIRYFLEQQGSCLANPLKDVDGVTIDVPQLIHDAAVDHHINPKVILATMQKEQSAITHCPETWRLKRLMGAGSASTARHQIDFGTSLFRAYQNELNSNGVTRSGWRVGVAKQTQDGVSVTPATKAVAGQFTYTPYAGVNWDGNNSSVGGVWLFWNAWYNQFHFDQPLPDPPDPPPSCEVPYFSQRDNRWRNHPLRTAGVCSSYCSTIGHCGCTLTSAAMLFNYYGSTRNPAQLSDCMGTQACPFYWYTGAACSQGQAQYSARYGFSWSRLEREVKNNDRPVILGMYRYKNGVKYTHWVVVLSGSGNKARNYRIHDPWPIHGAKMKLSAYNKWTFSRIAVYKGTPDCSSRAVASRPDAPMQMQPVSISPRDAQMPQTYTAPLSISEAQAIAASEVVTGSAWLYRMTDVTMTVQLVADSGAGNVTEMLLWTDEMTETTWQPFSTFTVLPRGEEIYVRFRDEAENTSAEAAETSHPPASPETAPFETYLPLVLRQ